MNWEQLLMAAATFGGAYAGASLEVRKLRVQLAKIERIVVGCPHHEDALKTEGVEHV